MTIPSFQQHAHQIHFANAVSIHGSSTNLVRVTLNGSSFEAKSLGNSSAESPQKGTVKSPVNFINTASSLTAKIKNRNWLYVVQLCFGSRTKQLRPANGNRWNYWKRPGITAYILGPIVLERSAASFFSPGLLWFEYVCCSWAFQRK